MDAGKDSLLRIRVSQEQSVSAYACENAEFFYLISGRMYMANAGQVTLLREGDFLVTPASQVHSFSAKDKVLYLIMQINGRAVRRYDIDPGQLQCTVKMSEEENVYNSKIRTLLGRLLGLYLSEAPEENCFIIPSAVNFSIICINTTVCRCRKSRMKRHKERAGSKLISHKIMPIRSGLLIWRSTCICLPFTCPDISKNFSA